MAMGKSTTAKLFAALGVPVHDSDAAVHRLYASGGAGAAAIKALVPEAVGDGGVDRPALAAAIAAQPALLGQVEAAVHPLVRDDREAFLRDAADKGAALVLFDIPLLFETSAETELDKVVVVTAPADVQRQRAFAREGMTEEKFQRLLARQLPDAEKRARADFIIDTSRGIDDARTQVSAIIEQLKEKPTAS